MSEMPLVHDDPEEGRERLAQLGLTLEDLHAAIRFGYLARLSCNANDPPASAGILFWGRMTRGLRERLAPRGWTRSDAKLSTTVSADETIAVVVSTGDKDTGVARGHPKTRFPKGPATREAVALNAAGQGELFALNLVEKQAPTMWVLLVAINHEAGKTVIRAELSRPSAMDEEGRVGGWFERIPLPPIIDDDDSRGARRDEREPSPDVDVDVRKRAG